MGIEIIIGVLLLLWVLFSPSRLAQKYRNTAIICIIVGIIILIFMKIWG